jgi:geranylgeranylglycerol-phosphate geranylgeranyltransferase
MQRIGGAISLFRPANGAISFLAIVSAGYIATPDAVPWGRLCLGAFAGMLVGSSGNILNDLLDIAIDRINRPGRALPSGKVSIAAAWTLFAITGVAGLAASLGLGVMPFLISVAAVLLIVLYNLVLKRIPIAGNCAVGVLTGSAMLFGALIAGSVKAGVLPGIFAFLTNVTREIVKDMEDVEGDTAEGVRTFPARAGMNAARMLVSACLVLIGFTVPLPWLLGQVRLPYLAITLGGVVPLLIFFTFVLRFKPAYKVVPTISTGLKAVMIMGIIAFILGV